MTAPAPARLITADEFLELDDTRGWELIDGVLTERTVSKQSSRVATWISWVLSSFVNPHHLGAVYEADLGIRIFAGRPDLVRKADLSFVATHRDSPADSGYLDIAPDLVVEVVSPGNRAAALAEKTAAWLDAGVTVVWVVFPSTRQLQVCRRGEPGITYGSDDEVAVDDILPGFRARVADLFPNF